MIGLSSICTTNALNHLHAVLVEHHSDVIFVDFVGVHLTTSGGSIARGENMETYLAAQNKSYRSRAQL